MKLNTVTYLTGLMAAVAITMTTPLSAEEVTTQTAAPSPSKVIGSVDLRPTWHTKSAWHTTEDTFELGYQFSPTQKVTVVQYLETNVYNPSASADKGLGLTIYDTFLRTRLSKLVEDKDRGLSFSYQNRVYVPTSQASRDAGMIAVFRNYLTFQAEFNPTFTLTLSELPIFAAYSRAGTMSATGGKANPVFENRVYLIGDINITDKWSLSVPLMFHQTRTRDFASTATNNNQWSYFLWTYPEVTYAVTANTSLGLAYYSSNLVKGDLSGFTLGDGLEDGVVQLVLGATL